MDRTNEGWVRRIRGRGWGGIGTGTSKKDKYPHVHVYPVALSKTIKELLDYDYELINPKNKRKVEWMPLCLQCGGYHWPRCEKGVDDGGA